MSHEEKGFRAQAIGHVLVPDKMHHTRAAGDEEAGGKGNASVGESNVVQPSQAVSHRSRANSKAHGSTPPAAEPGVAEHGETRATPKLTLSTVQDPYPDARVGDLERSPSESRDLGDDRHHCPWRVAGDGARSPAMVSTRR